MNKCEKQNNYQRQKSLLTDVLSFFRSKTGEIHDENSSLFFVRWMMGLIGGGFCKLTRSNFDTDKMT